MRFNIVIIIINLVFEKAYFILIYITITIKDTTKLFLYYIWKLHSFFIYVILNKKSYFVTYFIKELYHIYSLIFLIR